MTRMFNFEQMQRFILRPESARGAVARYLRWMVRSWILTFWLLAAVAVVLAVPLAQAYPMSVFIITALCWLLSEVATGRAAGETAPLRLLASRMLRLTSAWVVVCSAYYLHHPAGLTVAVFVALLCLFKGLRIFISSMEIWDRVQDTT